MGVLARWLGRKVVLFAILVLAVGFFTLVWPHIRPSSSPVLSNEWMSPEQIRDELTSERNAAQERLRGRVESLRETSEAKQQQRLKEASAELTALRSRRGEFNGFLDGLRPSRILEKKRLELRISALKTEIAALNSLASENRARTALMAARLTADRLSSVPTEAAIRLMQQACRTATGELQRFNQRWALDRAWRQVIGNDGERLADKRRTTCDKAEELEAKREAGRNAYKKYIDARDRYTAAQKWSVGTLEDVSRGIPETVLRNILAKAALLFVLILSIPLLIRCLFYFVLAPIAERRPAIRLSLKAGPTAPIPIADPSRTSVSIALGEREELLVRQGFLQSTSDAGLKETRWLVHWRHPLSSIASGLTFLTCISGAGSRTTISAVHDPLAEVTVVHLAKHASCVLHPRALAAIVQRVDEPLKITSHWRLASLHAWLTLQLRYLAFHGPAQLVIKGSRGVRVEPAESGRVFGQQQLVGFSTDLSYTVKRTETFWPYFLGREQLLKDRVRDGRGVLIVEEAPLTGRQGRGVKRGLEGAFDAGLKAFGL